MKFVILGLLEDGKIIIIYDVILDVIMNLKIVKLIFMNIDYSCKW